MPLVAILGDPVKGTTAGEHHGHGTNPHPPLPLSGKISGNCSSKVFIDGIPVALVGSETEETDACCAGNNAGGKIIEGFPKVVIEGRQVAFVGSEVQAHNGTAYVESSQQSLVYVGA